MDPRQGYARGFKSHSPGKVGGALWRECRLEDRHGNGRSQIKSLARLLSEELGFSGRCYLHSGFGISRLSPEVAIAWGRRY